MSYWKNQRLKEMNKILKGLGHLHNTKHIFYEHTSGIANYTKNKYSQLNTVNLGYKK